MRSFFVASSLACLVACGKAPAPSVLDSNVVAAPDVAAAGPDVAAAPDVATAPDVSAASDAAESGGSAQPGNPPVVVTDTGPKPLPATAIKVTGFAHPDAAIYVADGDYFLVSNINGKAFARDDNGFISKVKRDGTIEALKWIDGASAEVELHSPKGMVVRDGVLYVADVDHVRRFALDTGAPKGSIKGFDPDVRFTDVAFRRDTIAASDAGHDDTGTDNELGGIYGLDEEGATLVQRGAPEHPNRIGNGRFDLATTGSRIASQSDLVDLGLGQLDGIVVAAQARLRTITLVASRDKGALLEVYTHVPADETPVEPTQVRVLVDGLAGIGDFALTPDRVVAMPLADSNTLVITPVVLREIPMPADWNELQQLISRAIESGDPLRKLVDEKWGVYLAVHASMVGPLAMDLAPGEKLPKFPAGAWIDYTTILSGTDVVDYGVLEPLELTNSLMELGEPLCGVSSCSMGSHPTAHTLSFARNAAGELKLVGVLLTDSPGPDDAALAKLEARYDKAIARKIKAPARLQK